MLRPFSDYLGELELVHNGVKRALAGLPEAALDWVPGPGMNSLAVLVVHLTGAERYWIGEVAGRDPAGRDRATEFQVSGWSDAQLSQRLDEVMAHSRRTLEGISLTDLEVERMIPGDDGPVTVARALDHALAHAALHLGHIELTRQLWDQQHPAH